MAHSKLVESVRKGLIEAFDAGYGFADGKFHEGTPFYDYAVERRGREVDEIMAEIETGSPVPIAADVETLIAELEMTAERMSAADKMLAEAKSLRQTDNPERRTDLYMWTKPEQTVEGRAAAMLRQFAGQTMRLADA